MNFYDDAETKKLLDPLKADVAGLDRQLTGVRKRLSDERDRLASLKQRAEKLTAQGGEAMAGSVNDFEKYRVAVRKVRSETEATQEIVEHCEATVLPQVQADLTVGRAALRSALTKLMVDGRAAVETEMTALVGQAIALRDGFVDASAEIHADLGETIVPPAAAYPDLLHPRIDSWGTHISHEQQAQGDAGRGVGILTRSGSVPANETDDANVAAIAAAAAAK